MGDPTAVLPTDYLQWVRDLHRAGTRGRSHPLGTAGLIDDAAHARGMAAIESGTPVSLSRPLSSHTNERSGGRPGFSLEVFFADGPIAMGSDHLELDCHGRDNTHLDGLNHIGLDGTWYGGFAAADPGAYSVAEFARTGIFTRGLYVNVPALRGTEWVDPTAPVGRDDLDAALAQAGVTVEPGDALLLDMGRDRFEAAGQRADPDRTPGLGADGARWLVEHGISMLCWDFLDAVHPEEPLGSVHLLTWAIGLVLVDNCDHSRLRRAMESGRATCGVTVAPLPIVGGTGNNVNPLALL